MGVTPTLAQAVCRPFGWTLLTLPRYFGRHRLASEERLPPWSHRSTPQENSGSKHVTSSGCTRSHKMVGTRTLRASALLTLAAAALAANPATSEQWQIAESNLGAWIWFGCIPSVPRGLARRFGPRNAGEARHARGCHSVAHPWVLFARMIQFARHTEGQAVSMVSTDCAVCCGFTPPMHTLRIRCWCITMKQSARSTRLTQLSGLPRTAWRHGRTALRSAQRTNRARNSTTLQAVKTRTR